MSTKSLSKMAALKNSSLFWDLLLILSFGKFNFAEVKGKFHQYFFYLHNFGVFCLFKLFFLEYCGRDHFNPQCNTNEVVVMTHAKYGRMKLGKCITEGLRIGCEADVMDFLDRKCSNKQTCTINLYNDLQINDEIEKPCGLSLLQYLEADYYCQEGEYLIYRYDGFC